jgi:hypothetical protein
VGRPYPVRRGLMAEHGRGLELVRELSYAWGVTWTGGTRPDGKRVWFELRD